jgi:hypothetical protein
VDLRAEPVRYHIDRRVGLAEYRLGSAGAVLTWGNRVIEGRLIYEYLFLPAFNRLSRRYVGGLNDFHGLYLSLEQGAGDLYLHRQSGNGFAPLIGWDDAFFALNGLDLSPTAITIDVVSKKPAIGFYRWPVGWQGTFSSGTASHGFGLEITDLHPITNWLIGGFAMGIVRGTLDTPDGPKSLIGLAELII